MWGGAGDAGPASRVLWFGGKARQARFQCLQDVTDFGAGTRLKSTEPIPAPQSGKE